MEDFYSMDMLETGKLLVPRLETIIRGVLHQL